MANRTITITGAGSSNGTYVTIDGTKYYSATTLTVADGTQITCTKGGLSGSITVNGTTQTSPYTFSVSANTTINLSTDYYDQSITVTFDTSGGSGGAAAGEHYTRIGGTAYQIEGGKAKVGSIVYDLEKGLIKASGVTQEFIFIGNEPEPEPEMATVSTNGGSSSYAYATVNGKKYYSGSVEVEVGAVISIYVGGTSNTGNCYIREGSNTLRTGKGSVNYTVSGNILIQFSKSSNGYWGAIISNR